MQSGRSALDESRGPLRMESTSSRRAAPLWAFLLIILDVTIIYQLTARWDAQARWE